MRITITVVEDNPGVQEALATTIDSSGTLCLLGQHSSAEAAFPAILAETPDVALVDINLPGKSGIELVARLKSRLPRLQVMMITVYEDADLIFNSLQAGASGYLLKRAQPAEIVAAIEQLHAGGSPMSPEIARKVVSFFHRPAAQASEFDQLSRREMEILAELSKGYRYKEIGSHLNIGLETVRTHVHHIYEKLQVQSRVEAVLKFIQAKSSGATDSSNQL